MSAHGIACFPTAIGACGVAWSADGIVAVGLPEADADRLRRRLLRAAPHGSPETAPPAAVADAIARMVALLDGGDDNLADVKLDLAGVPDFHRRVYAVARAIPPGATRTYGDVAAELGDLAAARAVGQALGRNPVPIVVPCHRVLAAGGRLGGFSARGGTATKLRLLDLERVHARGVPTLF
jgi:methylated-DNA-[protein]-cysteine S-methyltransferase